MSLRWALLQLITCFDVVFSFICQVASRPVDNEVTFAVFESICHLLLTVSPLKGRGNPIKCLAQGHNKRTCRPISTNPTLFYAERHAGSCEYQFLNSFDSAKKSNLGLQTSGLEPYAGTNVNQA